MILDSFLYAVICLLIQSLDKEDENEENNLDKDEDKKSDKPSDDEAENLEDEENADEEDIEEVRLNSWLKISYFCQHICIWSFLFVL